MASSPDHVAAPPDEPPPPPNRNDEAVGGRGEEDGTLALARLLFNLGSEAISEGNFVDAVDWLSGALEIRVAHYGEFAPECTSAYYKFGCALLCKVQEETGLLGDVPKCGPNEESGKSTGCKVGSGGSKKGDTEQGQNSNDKDQEDEDGDTDKDDDEMEADEDDSDLDLAWGMLDTARAIVEKSPGNSMEKVNIFSALAEVSMEREDIDNSLGDYFKALAILEHLVEPEHCRIIELNFRICLVFELASKIGDAIPYCAKAISLCKSHMRSVKNAKDALLAGKDDNTSVVLGGSDKTALEVDIKLLTGILTELENKLEDLEQAMSSPISAVDKLMQIASKASSEQNVVDVVPRAASLTSSQIAASRNGFDSSTMSAAATTGSTITNLRVIGRGVKRATIKPISADPPSKRLAADSYRL